MSAPDIEPADPEFSAKRARLAEMYRDIFEVDRRGQVILEDLMHRFRAGPVLRGGIDAVLQTYHNDGQRSVLDHILRMINTANGADGPT